MNLMNDTHFRFVLQEEPSYHKTHKKILGFKSLKKGWHFGEGIPPEESRLTQSIELNREAVNLGFLRTNAFPGVDGEIRVTVYHQKHYLEFTIETDDTVTYIHEVDNQEIEYETGLSFEEAKGKIKAFREKEWNLSETSIGSILTLTCTDSSHSHLGPQATTEFLSSSNPARWNKVVQSANILKHSIKTPMAQTFTGNSQPIFYKESITSSSPVSVPREIYATEI